MAAKKAARLDLTAEAWITKRVEALAYQRIFGVLKHDKKFLFKLVGSGVFTSLGLYELGFNIEFVFAALIFVPLAGLFFTFLKMEANSKALRLISIAVVAVAFGMLTKSYFLTAAFFPMLEGATHKESLVRLKDFHWVKGVQTESCQDELNKLIARHALFHTLPKKAREGLAETCNVTQLEDGDVLIRQGEFNENLFMTGKGKMDVIADGIKVATLHRGDVVGEISASGLSMPVADVVATGDVVVFALPADTINRAAEKYPKFAEAMREMGIRRISGG